MIVVAAIGCFRKRAFGTNFMTSPSQSTCPPADDLVGYKRKTLSSESYDRVTQHLRVCRNCQKALVSLVMSGAHAAVSTSDGTSSLDPDTMIAPGAARTSAPDLEDQSLKSKNPSNRPKVPADYPFLEPPELEGALAHLGFYSVVRVLGSGGMGVVFEAVDQRLTRTVALKVLRPELADELYVDRFKQEARLAASLSDEHIVTIFEVGITNNVPFMAMEFLHGETLDAKLLRDGWLPVEEALNLLRQVAMGLSTAHGAGLIHRDIKPANLWLECHKETRQFKRMKILDFGLAKEVAKESNLTAAGMVVGTPSYMAPEQVYGLPCDQRTDLFSLGCVFFRMLTGKAPFTGENTLAVLEATVDSPAPDLELAGRKTPRRVVEILEQLLAKNPDDRPASAKVLIDMIDVLLRGGASSQQPAISRSAKTGLSGSTASGKKGGLWLALSGAAVAFAVITSVVLFMFSGAGKSSAPEKSGNTAANSVTPVAEPVRLTGKPIKVGVLFSQSGRLAPTEQPIRRAVLKALGDREGDGKSASPVGKHPVTIVMGDGGSEPAKFGIEAKRLVAEGCEVIFGCWTSSARKEVLSVLASHEGGKHSCLLFYPVHFEGLEDSSHAVYLGSLPGQQAERALEYARKDLLRGPGKKKIFIVGGDYVYPRASAEVIRMLVETRFADDFEVAGEAFAPPKLPSKVDTAVLPEIIKANPDLIISLFGGLDMNDRFITGMRHLGPKANPIPIFSFSLTETELQNMNDHDILPGEYLAGSYFGSIVNSKKNLDLLEMFRAGNAPLVVSEPMEKAFHGVELWHKARASLGDNPTPEEMRGALRSLPIPSVTDLGIHLTSPESAPASLYSPQKIHIGRIIEGRQISLATNVARAPEYPPDPYPGPTPLAKRSPDESRRARDQWALYLTELHKAYGGSWENPGIEPVPFAHKPWWHSSP